MSFTPSKYQQAIFDFVMNERGSAVIEAVAGSGKTTTILESLKLIPSTRSILFLAFNKSIAEELKSRVPSHVKAATFHSIAFGGWLKYTGTKPNIDANKTRRILDNMVGEALSAEDERLYSTFVTKLVGLAKGAGVGYIVADEPSTWFALCDHFDVTLDSAEADDVRGVEIARDVLRRSVEIGDCLIDFDDMLYLPLIKNVTFFKHDFVFVDEAQDTNGVQTALLARMVKPATGRLIAVGDTYQAIYGFRGADSDAMNKIATQFGAKRLPLSVSYRCPRSVVEYAKTIVPHIEAADGAIEGSVAHYDNGDHLFDVTTLKPEDAVVCRNTKPLVELAFRLIRAGVPCKILGREIGAGLSALVGKMKAKGIDKLGEKLSAYREREIAKNMSKGREDKAQAVEDRVDSIFAIIANLSENDRTVPALVKKIESLFSDNGKGLLTLCTVHKAKGLEWNRVFVLGAAELMPSPWARQDWQKKQEDNLLYVAVTRAKKDLAFLPLPPRKGE